MVAVGTAGRPGALRRRLAVHRVARVPLGARVAGVAGATLRRALTILRVVAVGLLAVRGLAGVALVAYGAWLAWPPAGFIVAGVALLADRLHDFRRPDEGSS